jgi:uncharacterized protein (DUF362 family)
MNRREFLAAAAAGLAACGAPSLTAPPSPRDHAAALDAAVAPLLRRVRRGDRVVLKVNANSGDPYPYSTSPLVVERLAGALRDHGARVTVGDRSFFGDRDTAGNLERNGCAPAARAAGADVAVFEDIAWTHIPAELVPHWVPPVRIPRLATDCDLLVNLACLKTHFITGTTLARKNLLGLVAAEDRARPGNLRVHERDKIHHQIDEIAAFVRPHWNVIDGWRALVSGGPTQAEGDRLADRRRVLGGPDAAALDAQAAEILGPLTDPPRPRLF